MGYMDSVEGRVAFVAALAEARVVIREMDAGLGLSAARAQRRIIWNSVALAVAFALAELYAKRRFDESAIRSAKRAAIRFARIERRRAERADAYGGPRFTALHARR